MAKKEKKKIMSKSIAQFAHTIGDFIKTANTQLADMLYISADEKKRIVRIETISQSAASKNCNS